MLAAAGMASSSRALKAESVSVSSSAISGLMWNVAVAGVVAMDGVATVGCCCCWCCCSCCNGISGESSLAEPRLKRRVIRSLPALARGTAVVAAAAADDEEEEAMMLLVALMVERGWRRASLAI